MFGKSVKIGFYILSYSPLYLMLIILNLPKFLLFLNYLHNKIMNPKATIVLLFDKIRNPIDLIVSITSPGWFFFVLSLLLLISVVVLLKFLNLKGYKDIPVSTYSEAGEEIMSYVITYLTPLLSIEINNPYSLIVNLFLFLIIGVIYTRNNLIYLNPIFIILGYHVLRDNVTQNLVISKYDIWELRELHEDNKTILGYKMNSSGLLLLKKNKNN